MRGIRYPAMLLCLLLLAGCQTEGEFRLHWKLWGFESRTFTVGDERVRVRVDTSGYGLYEVEAEAEEGAITVLRDGTPILKGWFTAEDYAELEEQGLAAEGYRIVEHLEESPGSLLLAPEAEDGEYAFFAGVEGSPSGAAFYFPGDAPEAEALDRVRRLQFTKLD